MLDGPLGATRARTRRAALGALQSREDKQEKEEPRIWRYQHQVLWVRPLQRRACVLEGMETPNTRTQKLDPPARVLLTFLTRLRGNV